MINANIRTIDENDDFIPIKTFSILKLKLGEIKK